jgi:hypothetical protein
MASLPNTFCSPLNVIRRGVFHQYLGILGDVAVVVDIEMSDVCTVVPEVFIG